MELKSGHGIWEELKSAQSATVALPHFVFDFVVVDVAQFQLTVSERNTKIIVILLSVVVNCIHFIAVAMLKMKALKCQTLGAAVHVIVLVC